MDAKKAVCTITLLMAVAFYGYEDKTHQALTRQAVEIAKRQGIGQDLADQEIQIINGAGEHWWGEDYTRYTIYDGCPWYAKIWQFDREPLNHFATGLLGADPAWVRFLTFWNDAITLWRHGNKPAAAFILGRAVHLVEDMAQPQHAMDEMHYPNWPFRHPSFLENFTEAHVNGTSGAGFCPYSTADYKALIAGINPQPLPVVSPQNPQGCPPFVDKFRYKREPLNHFEKEWGHEKEWVE